MTNGLGLEKIRHQLQKMPSMLLRPLSKMRGDEWKTKLPTSVQRGQAQRERYSRALASRQWKNILPMISLKKSTSLMDCLRKIGDSPNQVKLNFELWSAYLQWTAEGGRYKRRLAARDIIEKLYPKNQRTQTVGGVP